jgi:methyl-accepting chemotaxis protein
MPNPGKRTLIGKGRGYLNLAGPQFRFIVFLLIILMVYTFLLKVFQKLAEFVQFPVFLPIALITLLFFIGIAGSTYSHTIVGPLLRIRWALERLAEGDMNISLRLRESDDPMLKEIVKTITALKEHTRNSHAVIQESAKDLFKDAEALAELVQRGADKTEVLKQLDMLRKKQDLLDKAVKSLGKA